MFHRLRSKRSFANATCLKINCSNSLLCDMWNVAAIVEEYVLLHRTPSVSELVHPCEIVRSDPVSTTTLSSASLLLEIGAVAVSCKAPIWAISGNLTYQSVFRALPLTYTAGYIHRMCAHSVLYSSYFHCLLAIIITFSIAGSFLFFAYSSRLFTYFLFLKDP